MHARATHVMIHMSKSKGQLCGGGSPLPSLCDLQKSNSAQAWFQAPLRVKPSYQPGPDVQPDIQEMGFQRMHESLHTVCKLFMQEYCTMAIFCFS